MPVQFGSTARPWDGGQSLSDEAGGWETIAPSPLVFGAEITRAPRAMSLEDIRTVREAFRAAAARALHAGCEWLELHAAHGYLLHECSGFQVPFAERIRKEADILSAAVGYITSPMQADGIVRNGRADLVLLARQMLRTPYWALEAAGAQHQKSALKPPVQYARAID